MTESLEALAFDYDHARATYDSVRRIAQVVTVAEAQALARKVLGDAGFPMADEAWVEYHPWEESAHGRVGWDLNEGITPPIPGMLLGPTGMNEFTVLHECAHILRNGPEMAGTRYRGTDLEADGGHDQRWWDTLTRLVGMYGTALFASAFDHLVLPDVEPGLRRVAGAWGPLPEGLTFEVIVSEHANVASVIALHPDAPVGMYGDNRAGHITWDLGLEEIDFVKVIPQFRRRGLATELLRRAREVTPGLRHSEILSADGTAWSRKVAGPASTGLTFVYEPSVSEYGGLVRTTPRVVAYDGEREVGFLSWDVIDLSRFDTVSVRPDYRRRGIATRLWEEAKKVNPDLDPETSVFFTQDGRGWVDSLTRTAAVTWQIVERDALAGWKSAVALDPGAGLEPDENNGLLADEVGIVSYMVHPDHIEIGWRATRGWDWDDPDEDYTRRGVQTALQDWLHTRYPDKDVVSDPEEMSVDAYDFWRAYTTRNPGSRWRHKTAGPASNMVPLDRFPVLRPTHFGPRDVKVLRMAQKDIDRLPPGQRSLVAQVLEDLRAGRAQVEEKQRGVLRNTYTVRVTRSLRLGLYLSDDQPGGDPAPDWIVYILTDHDYDEAERRMRLNATRDVTGSASRLVMRGFSLTIESEADARVLLGGGQAAADVMLRLITQDGSLGVWWTSEAGEVYSHAEVTSGDYDLSIKGSVEAADRGEGFYGCETPVVLAAAVPTAWEQEDWQVPEGSPIRLVSVKYSLDPMDDNAWVTLPVGRILTAGSAWSERVGSLPSGLRFETAVMPEHLHSQGIGGTVYAFLEGANDEELRWPFLKDCIGILRWFPGGEISDVWTHEDYRRQGLATELLRRAREADPTVHHSETLTNDGRAWRAAVGSLLRAAPWHRGMQVMLDVKDPRAIALLEALASGATTVARDRLIELMAGGSGYDPWTGNRNGPREGAGGWWTTDTSAAWTYATGIPMAGEEDDAIHASVILHAEISDEYEADFDGSGYGWHHLDPGTPLTITGVTATLPMQQQARLLVDLARSQGMWFDPMGMGGDDFVYPGLSEQWEIEERIYEWPLTMRTQASLGSSQAYFHGTSVALGAGTVIAPREPGAWEPGQPTRSPGERFSDPAVAYATTEESDAWHWAEHAWNAGRGDLPRVYRVRPLGEVHPDPNNEFAGDVVSPDGFEVVEEVTSGSDYDFWREGSLGKTAMADYWMNHRPQQPGVGVPSLDACATAFGYDEGDEDAFYRSGVDSFAPSADYSAEAVTQVRAARGKPDLLVDIYRAVPPGVDRFAQGDWVTLSRAYAGEHLHEILGGNGTVLHARVPARQVFPSGEWDVLEWGYWGVGARTAALERTAMADLMLNRGVFYRVHHLQRAFSVEDAWSAPLRISFDDEMDEPREGYSCYSTPWELWAYVALQSWTAGTARDEILIFSGDVVGEGIDGEPLVVPDHRVEQFISWRSFLDALAQHTGKFPEGGFVGGVGAMPWLLVAIEALQEDPSDPVAQRLMADAARDQGVSPQMAGEAFQMLFANRRTATHDVQGDLYLITDVPDAMDLVLDLSDASSEEVVVRLGESLDNVVMQFPSLDPVVTSVWSDGKFVSATARGWGYITDLAVLRERLALAPRG